MYYYYYYYYYYCYYYYYYYYYSELKKILVGIMLRCDTNQYMASCGGIVMQWLARWTFRFHSTFN